MGDMADYYAEQSIVDYYSTLHLEEASHELKQSTGRYSVSDEDIKDLIFETSIKSLCLLADKVVTEFYPEEKYDSPEMNKIIDIAGWGLAKKHLTNKQKWNLASFIIFYTKGEM